MEDIIEFLLSKENEDENFLSFCENNMIEKIINITAFQEKSINLIIIKSFGILIPSLKNNKIMYYLFSKNYMNQIITNISYNKEENDIDYLSFYINFLKTLVNKLDIASFALFFNQSQNKFPLLDEIIVYLTYDQDVMIKNTSRNIFLSLLKLNYEPFIEYICDLPTITLFLLFAENLKNQMKFFCQNKENSININSNNNFIYKINGFEEIEEILIDDISFVQDILSINIPKINYLLINTIFYIPIGYLFNNILTKLNANVSFYILRLFLEILKNETIKNIITFILYSSRIQIKIIEIVANEETMDIYRLLKLNIYLFHSNINNIKSVINHNLNILSFNDYLTLNYSKKFLSSIRYIKDTDNTYIELKDISNKLNMYENIDGDINLAIKFLNKKIDKINFVIKQIENYHGFISRATGINCGGAENAANDCFLQIIYNNLIAYKENNMKNKYLQENIFKNECIYYLYDFHLSQNISTVNELFLLYEIINNKDISEKLKLNLNLIKNSMDKTKSQNKNNNFIDINSIEESDNPPPINEKKYNNLNFNPKNQENPKTLDTPPAPGILEVNKNIDIKSDFKRSKAVNFSVIQQQNDIDLYKQIFGKDININNIRKNNINYSSFLSLPNPINNNININQFNCNMNLIVDNKIMKYTDLVFNNNFFCKILMNYKTNNELNIAEKIIDLMIDGKKILNKIIYKLSIDILEDLLLNSIIFWSIKRKYQHKINEHYKHILQMINDFLSKNNLLDQTNNNYFYEFFEQCFIFNKKDINKDIKKNIFKIPILLTNPPKEVDENANKIYTEQFDILKIPEEKYQIIKCLFQKMLSLYDLKFIINNFNDTKKSDLIKTKKFPLYFFDLDEFKIDIKINITKLKINFYKLKFKLDQEEFFNEGILFINKNYCFICVPHIVNKIIQNKEIKSEEKNEHLFNTIKDDNNSIKTISDNDNLNSDDDYYIIKYRFPLRNIEIALCDKKEDKNKKNNNEYFENKGKKLILINNETKIYLLCENKINNIKIETIIKENIKKAVEMEYNSLKMYINELLNNYSTLNN